MTHPSNWIWAAWLFPSMAFPQAIILFNKHSVGPCWHLKVHCPGPSAEVCEKIPSKYSEIVFVRSVASLKWLVLILAAQRTSHMGLPTKRKMRFFIRHCISYERGHFLFQVNVRIFYQRGKNIFVGQVHLGNLAKISLFEKKICTYIYWNNGGVLWALSSQYKQSIWKQ